MKSTLRKRLNDRDRLIVALLDALSRQRTLNRDELAMMDNACRRLGIRIGKRDKGRWTPEEDALLAELHAKWIRSGRPPPYQPDNTVRDLAESLGRSYLAVHRRMERLRKRNGWKNPPSRAEISQKFRDMAQRQLFKRSNGHAALECGGERQARTAETTLGQAVSDTEGEAGGQSHAGTAQRPPARVAANR